MEYARYQLSKKQVQKGTPLEQFAFLTSAEIESLKIRGIFTVEALAELDKDKAVQLEITREQELAKKFLLRSKDNNALLSWQKKEEEYVAQIEQLKKALSANAATASSKNRRKKQ